MLSLLIGFRLEFRAGRLMIYAKVNILYIDNGIVINEYLECMSRMVRMYSILAWYPTWI